VNEVFTKCSTSAHLELQQRACEYIALPNVSADVMEAVLNPMPPFELEAKPSALLGLALESSHVTGKNADRAAFTMDVGEKTGAGNAASYPGQQVQQQVQRPSPAPAAVVDLLSMDDGFDGSSSSSAAGADIALLRAAALCRTPGVKSLLLCNDMVSITFSADYRAHQARVGLFFENVMNYDILNLK
ncbi:hypothetical protein B484DRAFT_406062, partial [Ochromonadaceae sp. CCMP2298]